jgi:hypothetical protein
MSKDYERLPESGTGFIQLVEEMPALTSLRRNDLNISLY